MSEEIVNQIIAQQIVIMKRIIKLEDKASGGSRMPSDSDILRELESEAKKIRIQKR